MHFEVSSKEYLMNKEAEEGGRKTQCKENHMLCGQSERKTFVAVTESSALMYGGR